MNILLIGFMGSGKTVVAKLLSKQIGSTSIDMDDVVFQKVGVQNMREVFQKGGEILLRETEIAIAKEYARKENLVVSAGGGVVLNKIIIDYFKKENAKVIFLNASFETVLDRLKEDCSRPLFEDSQAAKKIYDFRLPLYLEYADEIIDVDFLAPEQIVKTIRELISRV